MGSASTSIEIWRGPAARDTLRVATDFGTIVRSERMSALLTQVAKVDGIVIAAVADNELRGYATLVPSSALTQERWENLPDTFELGSLEVARSSRGNGIATTILGKLVDTLPIEHRLLFARGFVGHWDLAGTKLTPTRYRRMLLRMLDRVGFQCWETDDPEVGDHPLNFFAVRVGLQVPAASLVALTERASPGGGHTWW